MSDILDLLRTYAHHNPGSSYGTTFSEAADEIERLRAALRLLAEDDTYLRHLSEWHDVGHMQRGVQAIARAALENK